jgi:hypothetical protein
MKGLSVCPWQAFPASLMFVGKGGAYLSEVPFRVLQGTSEGRLLALPTNIRLGWKDLQGTNTLAYYKTFVNIGRKKFHNIEPDRMVCLQL